MRKKLHRLLRLVPVAMLLCAGIASAQVTGQIVGQVTDAASGKPVAGALVIATSPGLQGESTAVTDAKGEYVLTTLPPGKYKVAAQLSGYKPTDRSDIVLRVGYTLRANLSIVPEAVQMEEQVVKTGLAPVVNIGTAEAGTIVSKEYMSTIPTARTYENVATIAPTAQRDFYGISFAGASSPENNYIIDGLRVSDPALGTLGTNLLTNFVDQLDIKVGSFMPEYGYSSAGIINTVTKSGGNEFHGSIWGNITPGFFTPALPSIGTNGDGIATYSSPYKGSYAADFGLEVGGPIVKDKLWFYAGFAPQMTYNARTAYFRYKSDPCVVSPSNPNCKGDGSLQAGTSAGFLQGPTGQFNMTTIPGSDQVYGAGFNTYFGIAKLTWLINENNNIFASFNTQPTTDFGRGTFYASPAAANIADTNNTTNATLNYTGKFLDKHLLVEVKGGWFNSTFTEGSGTVAGVDRLNTPAIGWLTVQPMSTFFSGFTCPGGANSCVLNNYTTGGTGFVSDPVNNRYSGSVALTGLFSLAGQHQLKGGAQIEYATYDNTRYYSGGGIFSARGIYGAASGLSPTTNSLQISRGYGVVQFDADGLGTNICTTLDANGNCVNPGFKNNLAPGKLVQGTGTWSNGYYVQDSWTIANVLTLNFGVRLDTQTLKNTTATGPTHPTVDDAGVTPPSVNITNEWAPRVQAVWDFTGQGRGKIQGNWGMYYEAIPLDLALRSLGIEAAVQGGYQMSSCNAGFAPGQNSTSNPFAQCPNVMGLAAGVGPGPNTVDLSGTTDVNGVQGFYAYNPFYTPVAPGLKGAFTYQFGGGIEYEVLQDLSIGVNYLGRRLGDVIEDISSNDGSTFIIANPGTGNAYQPSSQTGYVSPQYATGTDNASGSQYFVKWPKPTRSYDAFTVTLNKNFSKNWLMQASYTWSSLRGNYPGLFRGEDGQLDPNITSEYDLVSLLGNKQGPLGGNRNNQIKLAASYAAVLSPVLTLVPSTNFQAFSGQPVSALARHPLYGVGQSFVLPRGVVGDLPWTFQFDVGAKAIWAISGPYTLAFSLDIFNLLNMTTTQWVDQNYSIDSRILPMQNSQCSNKTSISAANPLTALQAACSDLRFARATDGQAPVLNPNFGQPAASPVGVTYQSPISARFGVQLSF
jgi:outer membrane receptor protein involved in Fe transport